LFKVSSRPFNLLGGPKCEIVCLPALCCRLVQLSVAAIPLDAASLDNRSTIRVSSDLVAASGAQVRTKEVNTATLTMVLNAGRSRLPNALRRCTVRITQNPWGSSDYNMLTNPEVQSSGEECPAEREREREREIVSRRESRSAEVWPTIPVFIKDRPVSQQGMVGGCYLRTEQLRSLLESGIVRAQPFRRRPRCPPLCDWIPNFWTMP
jgi:hypothetical protein